MELTVRPIDVDFVYDELDTNAITFRLADGYFSIQTCVYLEDDERLNEPMVELGSQGAQSGGLVRVLICPREIRLQFRESLCFLHECTLISIVFDELVDVTLVDFFVNHLFLGDILIYGDDFDASKKVIQTRKREYL
ncbi:hypothetical protein BLA17378_00788 [Burkholderia aenigmatica]|uniref:Uncharacterized protein n=2 Tax=Burkholderia aenigmatica TaxID=2015348 RepID=A0ABY6XJV2_9BURK|nr:hypothetical protein [Burkholderia sp. LMG 13014]VWC50933.1 hypothetical protein BLA17378_00788 [Burkholderia aenigmatica]VWD05474.1 hypothetical protein BLA18628_02825 [Burkholderia aenigmatica]